MKDIKQILTQIQTHKHIISLHRDELRKIYDELGDVIDTFDRGVEGLESGKREIEDAIDALSEQI